MSSNTFVYQQTKQNEDETRTDIVFGGGDWIVGKACGGQRSMEQQQHDRQ
jgi:hypothetical protein